MTKEVGHVRTTVADVMTRAVVSVSPSTPFREIVRRMHEHRVSAVPVVDRDEHLLGIVSEGDLILKEDPGLGGSPRLLEGPHRRLDRSKAAGLRASELMSVPVHTIRPNADLGNAARTLHLKAVKRLPVVDPKSGRLVGILSRSDLLKVYLRDDAEIAEEISEHIIRRTLWLEPGVIRITVRDGLVTAHGQLERKALLPSLERLILDVPGVAGFESRLTFPDDDPLAPPSANTDATASEIYTPWSSLTKALRW
jgi:CBS domain-containing protein